MHSDLMHSSCKGLAMDNATIANFSDSLKRRLAVLAFGGDLTNSDFVAHHIDWLTAFNNST